MGADRGSVLGRVTHGTAATLSTQVIAAVSQLVLVPLFLARWSPAIYGEWLALFSLVGYLATLDLGMQTSVINRLTQAYARHDFAGYASVQRTALAFYLAVFGVGALALGAATALAPVHRWLGLVHTSAGAADSVLWLLGIQVLASMPAGLLLAVYRTTGNLAATQWITNAQKVVAVAAIGVALALDGSMREVALALLVPLLVTAGLVWLDVRRRLPALAPNLGRPDTDVLRTLLVPGLLFAMIVLANAIAQQGPVLLVSSWLGGAAVAVFATSRTLANLIRQLIGALNSALWPDLTAMESRGELERLRRIHRLLVVVSSAAAIAAGAVLWFVGADIMQVWTGGRLEPDPTLLRLLLVMTVAQTPWLASSVFPAASNRHARLARSYLVAAVVGVALAAVAVGRLGVVAMPLGLIAGEVLACYYFVARDTCRMLGEPPGRFLQWEWTGFIVVMVGTLAVVGAVDYTLAAPLLLRCATLGAAASLTAAAVSWTLWLRSDERETVAGKLRVLMSAARA